MRFAGTCLAFLSRKEVTIGIRGIQMDNCLLIEEKILKRGWEIIQVVLSMMILWKLGSKDLHWKFIEDDSYIHWRRSTSNWRGGNMSKLFELDRWS